MKANNQAKYAEHRFHFLIVGCSTFIVMNSSCWRAKLCYLPAKTTLSWLEKLFVLITATLQKTCFKIHDCV